MPLVELVHTKEPPARDFSASRAPLGENNNMSSASAWRGYWEQRGWGRQPMHDVVLAIREGVVAGQGRDCVGRFTFQGTWDSQGVVSMMKQYVRKHQVLYQGQYDGEGTIFGHWSIALFDSGEFMLSLVPDRAACAELAECFEPSGD